MPGRFLIVAAAPASATTFHSSPDFGSTFQLVRGGAPMILAICGLTSDGTGTDRAGTSSIGAAVWANAGTANIMPPHNTAMLARCHAKDLRIVDAAPVIARFPVFSLLLFSDGARHRTRFCNPVKRAIFPKGIGIFPRGLWD